MPLYNLQSQQEEDQATKLARLVGTLRQNQNRRQVMGNVYQQAAAGQIRPEYEIDPSTGSYKVAYKPVNQKENAEAALLKFKLKQAQKMAAGGGGSPYNQAVDRYPKEYDEYGLPSKFGSKAALKMQQRSKEANEMIKQANADTKLFEVTQDIVETLKKNYYNRPDALTPEQENLVKDDPFLFAATRPAKSGDLGGLDKPIKGFGRMTKAALGTDVPLSTYLSGRRGFISNVARSVGAEKGVLTDPDVLRAASLLPSEYKTEEEAEALWKQIDDIIRKRLEKNQKILSQYKGQDFGDMEDESLEFDSEEDADAANLQPGTRVYIKGRGWGTVK